MARNITGELNRLVEIASRLEEFDAHLHKKLEFLVRQSNDSSPDASVLREAAPPQSSGLAECLCVQLDSCERSLESVHSLLARLDIDDSK